MNGSKLFIRLKKLIDIETTTTAGRRAKMVIGTMKQSKAKIALIVRGSDQVYRGGRATMTDARKDGVLCWMLESSLIPHLKEFYGVRFVIMLERETGDMWVSKMDDWDDEEKLFKSDDVSVMRTDRRGFALKHLPVQHMLHIPAERDLLSRAS